MDVSVSEVPSLLTQGECADGSADAQAAREPDTHGASPSEVQKSPGVLREVVWNPQCAEFIPQAAVLPPLRDGPWTLHRSWALWAVLWNKRDQQIRLGCINTVEKFWALVNALKPPSMQAARRFAFFRKPVLKPSRQSFPGGGRWVAAFDSSKVSTIDELWLTIMLILIGESIHDCGEHVCGAQISVHRTGAKLSLWIENASVAAVIGKQFHRLMRKISGDLKIALPDFLFEDFGLGAFTYVIKAVVAPVIEDDANEQESEVAETDDEEFDGLGAPADPDSESDTGDALEDLAASATQI